MNKTLTLGNHSNKELEIHIEPAAEFFGLGPGQTAIVEIHYGQDERACPLEIVYDDGAIILFECEDFVLEIKVDDKLIYFSDYG